MERMDVALLVLALLSIMVGNFSALRQTSARRMLAFSSVAHAGYVLLALVLPSQGGTLQLTGFVYYLVGYAIANAGALTAIAAMSGRDDLGDDLEGLSGQGRAHPFFGIMATIFIVSIAGIPPTVGFLGKYLIFADLVAKDKIAVAAFGMLMAVIGATYYLRLVIAIWTGSRVEERRIQTHALSGWTMATAALAIIALLAAPSLLSPRSQAPVVETAAAP
jgi:NADH-quinone oxidoreductase subunit N